MRNNDIKKLINLASDSEEYNVDSEDIKKELMEKISKNGITREYSESETVNPIFVTAVPKAKKYYFAKITAGAVAACLGIGIIGTAAYYNSGRLPTIDSDNAADTAQYTEDNTQALQTALAAFTQNTDPVQTAVTTRVENKGTPTIEEIQISSDNPYIQHHLPNSSLDKPFDCATYLLDGTLVRHNSETGEMDFSTNVYTPITKENGRLYFTGDGKKRDITDRISSDDYFVVSYVNPITGLTHYFIVGGDLQAQYYGYIELFWLPNDNKNAYFDYRFYTGEGNIFPDIPNKDWLDRTLKEISDQLKGKKLLLDFIGDGSVSTFK